MNAEEIIQKLDLLWVQLTRFWSNRIDYFRKLSSEELGLQIISIAIVIIAVLAIFLAFYVLFLRIRNSLRAHRLHRLEKMWEAELIKVVMSDEIGTRLSFKIKKRDQAFFVSYLARFAQRLQGRELERVKDISKPYLAYFARGLNHRYPELRARTLNIIGLFGLSDFSDVISRSLEDDSPLVAMTAARVLAHPEHPEYCSRILLALGKFDQWSMSFLAAMLARMGSAAAPELIKALEDESRSIRSRIACSEALRNMSHIPAGDHAAKLLALEENAELKAALLRLLGSIGVPRHKALILEALKDSAFIVRVHAIQALSQIGSAQDVDYLMPSFDDASDWVTLHAARAVVKLGRQDVLQSLPKEYPRKKIVTQVLAEQVDA